MKPIKAARLLACQLSLRSARKVIIRLITIIVDRMPIDDDVTKALLEAHAALHQIDTALSKED